MAAVDYTIGGNDFEASLKKFGEKALNYANAVVHRVVIDLAATIIYRSPWGRPELWARPAPKDYKPGQFRANWQYGEGVAPSAIVHKLDKEGKDTVRAIAKAIKPTDAAEHTHYIVNKLPYGPRLEYEQWSSQAPAGMVGITVLQFDSIVKKAVGSVKGGLNADE